MFSKVLKNKFDQAWWFGFAGAIAIIATIILEVISSTYVVLTYGILHMLVLAYLGGKAIASGESNIEIGHRVSTMGYLHTLVGTSVALILVATSNHDANHETQEILKQMDMIVAPIGSALITSIIGWAVGTEMEREKYSEKEEKIIDDSLKNLSENIDNLGEALEKSSLQWSNSIDDTVTQLSNTTQSLQLQFEKALNTSSQKLDDDSKVLMEKYFVSFDGLLKKSDKQIEVIQEKFNRSSDDATKIMNGLQRGFEAIFEQMNDQAKEIEKNFMTSSNGANKVIEDLSLSYKKLFSQTKRNVDRIERNLNKSANNSEQAIDKFIKSFENLFNTMQTYSDIMQEDFKHSTDNAQKTMDGLSDSFTTVFEQLDKLSMQWERHISDMESFSNSSSHSLRDLLKDSRKVAKEIEEVATGMPNAAQILREAESILEIIRIIKERDVL